MSENYSSLEVIPVFVRISKENIEKFNQNNVVKIEELREELKKRKATESYFQKIGEGEHKIITPIGEGQLELVVVQHFSETYEAVVHKRQKTVYRNFQKIPQTAFQKAMIILQIIGMKEKGRATDQFVLFYEKVEQLKVSSVINIEEQHEIWAKWIEARKAIIESLQTPYLIKSSRPVIKEELTRYTLEFQLSTQFHSEYQQLEQRLQSLGIEEHFDSEGSILLTRTEWPVLNAVLQREFADKIEKSTRIGAILKVRPFSMFKKIQDKVGVPVFQNYENQKLYVDFKATEDVNQIFREYGYELDAYQASFTIYNHGNIAERADINKRYRLSFGQRSINNDHSVEIILPPSEGNTLTIERKEYYLLQVFYKFLINIYGKSNISTQVRSVYKLADIKTYQAENKLTEEFWLGLKRELYLYNLDEVLNPYTRSIYLEASTEEELIKIFLFIQSLQICDFAKSPLDEDFRFKIKTNLIAKKAEKETFLEKIGILHGVEFVAEINDSRYPQFVQYKYIGKLNANDSHLDKIVLALPLKYETERNRASEVLEWLNKENKPQFNKIRANLAGDLAKLEWLQTAFAKITEPNQAPNGAPVNPQLGNFIFDTSQAAPIDDVTKIAEGSSYELQVQRNALLPLNASQRKALLAAIHCQDLALLQGPPGSGKTTVIAEIIWQILSQNPSHKILLTSETNLAVDNAIDRLLNTKYVNPRLERYTTLIKPLRLGAISKLDEQGAKYSVHRIRKWADANYQIPTDDALTLEEQNEGEEAAEKVSLEQNAVQEWMRRISERTQLDNPKYRALLQEWREGLLCPSPEVKKIFKDKYIEYANVVGSTCSSCGSPKFMQEAAEILGEKEQELKELQRLQQMIRYVTFGKEVKAKLEKLNIPKIDEYFDIVNRYRQEYFFLMHYFSLEENKITETDKKKLHEIETVNGFKITKKEDIRKLLSYNKAVEYGVQKIIPFLQPSVAFHTVIMDEASKATPPELVLPLCLGKRSIVIGDHRQLPPMLNDRDFQESLQSVGAQNLAKEIDASFTETSQFEKMILNPNVSPTIISRCNIQYRMHPDINNVIKQFYLEEGGLEPAEELITHADDTNLNNPFSRYHGINVPGLIEPHTHTIWVNVQTPEEKEGTSVINEGEVKAIRVILESLKKESTFENFQKFWEGITDSLKQKQEKEIAVISFYSAQKRLLKNGLLGIGLPLKINTVDRFQGMERNIVIVSTVRSHIKNIFGGRIEPNKDCGFAKSPQRLNVALSRAKRLLIVVGNKDFFSEVKDKFGNFLYQNAIREIEKKGKIIDFSNFLNVSLHNECHRP
jgi:superfamily I DNA and/or RNA helicase